MTYSTDTQVPAYIKIKYSQKCSACGQMVNFGELGFYAKAGNCIWHSKCGNPDWKVPGTAYHQRRSAAIMFQIANKSLDLKTRVKLALRRFRRELRIDPKASPVIASDVYQYLFLHNLIDTNTFKTEYYIVPKGFNWNVDNGMVQLPSFDDDIMERDQEIEENLINQLD